MIKDRNIRAVFSVLCFCLVMNFSLFNSVKALAETTVSQDKGKALAQVVTVRGTAKIGNQKLKLGDYLEEPGVLATEEKSFIKLVLFSPKSVLILGPSSQMKLERKENDVQGEHLQGMVRFLVAKIKLADGSEKKGQLVRTKNAAMGIRGTDFMVVFNPLLQESEIIVFDGKVLFQSQLSEDEKMVPAGHWGGLGGRYTQKIGDLIKLPENVLQTFDQQSKVDTDIKGAVKNDELYGEKIPSQGP